MDESRFARLTKQQRTCLRYVSAQMTSKEIAPLLGIEPGSVDQHIKAAMKTLDVNDRRSAARLFVQHEQGPSQPLVYQSPEVAAGPLALETPQPAGGRQSSIRRETSTGTTGWRSSSDKVRPEDLNWISRLLWIVLVAVGMALAFGVLVSSIDALGKMTGRP